MCMYICMCICMYMYVYVCICMCEQFYPCSGYAFQLENLVLVDLVDNSSTAQQLHCALFTLSAS